MSKQEVILCKELENDLTHAIGKCPHDKLFILTDEHTHRLCLPQLPRRQRIVRSRLHAARRQVRNRDRGQLREMRLRRRPV